MAIWSRLTAAISGFGVGGAASTVAGPIFEVPRQSAWEAEPNRILGLSDLAQLVATGLAARKDVLTYAKRNGFDGDKLDARIQLFLAVPGVSELAAMLNRGTITTAQFEHAIGKHAIEQQYHEAIRELVNERLDPGQLAAAIHRGLIPDPGLLRGQQPEPPFNVEAYPTYQIDALDEARASGYDRDRLGVLVGLQGLPMGVIEAAQSVYRGIITHGDYIRAFNESNNRNEWADAVLKYARQIPTARDFIENALRGYRTLEQAQQGAALHGMSAEHARLIFQNSGRPLNLHQITQALAWGAKYNPLPGDDPDPYMNAVLIGAVTPAYYEMQDTLKYNLPSAFFFRVLQQNGVLSADEAVTWYKRLGWPPELARKVADAFAATATGASDPHVSKAQTQLWNTLHTSFRNGETDEATARATLAYLGVSGEAQDTVIETWGREAALIRKQLTPAQIAKGFKNAAVNDATGEPWTQDEAVTALVDRGYSVSEARSLLNIAAGK